MPHKTFGTRSCARSWAVDNLKATWFYPFGVPEYAHDLNPFAEGDYEDCVIIEEVDPYHATEGNRFYVYYQEDSIIDS